MGFVDEVLASTEKAGGVCTIALVLNGLTPKDRAEIEAVLDDPKYQHSAIARALTKRFDQKIIDSTVSRHRRRHTASGCSCP